MIDSKRFFRAYDLKGWVDVTHLSKPQQYTLRWFFRLTGRDVELVEKDGAVSLRGKDEA